MCQEITRFTYLLKENVCIEDIKNDLDSQDSLNCGDTELQIIVNALIDLQSKICDHTWEDSFTIKQVIGEMQLPDGGKVQQQQLIPVMLCMKCFHLRQKNPEEVAEMQKDMNEGIILPGDSRGNLITPP